VSYPFGSVPAPPGERPVAPAGPRPGSVHLGSPLFVSVSVRPCYRSSDTGGWCTYGGSVREERPVWCQDDVRAILTEMRPLRRSGLCVVVSPRYNDAWGPDGRPVGFREWRSFDGSDWEEVRFEAFVCSEWRLDVGSGLPVRVEEAPEVEPFDGTVGGEEPPWAESDDVLLLTEVVREARVI
jgi:hypothetical protein